MVRNSDCLLSLLWKRRVFLLERHLSWRTRGEPNLIVFVAITVAADDLFSITSHLTAKDAVISLGNTSPQAL
jgi:hypothetical protein